jgi:FMN-dependent oxidoreductase (nitrilotriacetate monooxygenase family)
MVKEIRLNAFEMNCVAHQSPGMWRHPRDRSRDYRRLDGWIELAKTLERGLFDGLFLADVLGVYDVFGGSPEAALTHATQTPVNDPLLLVPAMAAATRHLGFGVTVTLSYEPRFPFARRMSTLDHLTEGRIGWNVVTGYLDSAAKGMGETGQRAHDDRYAVAEDYMSVVYKLWEGSWADDAVVADVKKGVCTRPDRVRRVHHDGPHYKLDALHLSEPSPQRTPVLYQAGTSPAGRAFAARHAECVFTSGPSKKVIAPRVAAIRKLAAEAGRDPQAILMFAMMTVIVAPTDGEAEAKLADYRQYADPEGALTLMSGWSGVDFSRFDPDQVVEHVESEGGRTALENIRVPTRIGAGRSARSQSTSRLAGSVPSSLVRPQASPISSRVRSTTRISMGSTSPSSFAPKRLSTSSTCWRQSCSAAVATREPMRKGRCGRSYSAIRVWAPSIPRLAIDGVIDQRISCRRWQAEPCLSGGGLRP